jgi:hypothetical protein
MVIAMIIELGNQILDNKKSIATIIGTIASIIALVIVIMIGPPTHIIAKKIAPHSQTP